MSSGKFWSGILPANTDQDTGVTPAEKVRTVSINLVNLGATPTTVKVYVGLTAVPVAADRVEPDFVMAAGALYERTGRVVGPGERVVLHVDTADVTCRIDGFEENA